MNPARDVNLENLARDRWLPSARGCRPFTDADLSGKPLARASWHPRKKCRGPATVRGSSITPRMLLTRCRDFDW